MGSINAKLLEQKKAFNYHWIGLEHQHGHRDVMCKRSSEKRCVTTLKTAV